MGDEVEQVRAISADQLGWVQGGGLQPWSEVVMPPLGGEAIRWPTVSMARAMSVPAVGRGVGLISDLIRSMSMQLVRGTAVLPQPRLLANPCPDMGTAWFVGCQVEDYLLHGNALHYITVRGWDGYPLAATWLPAQWTSIGESDTDPGECDYWVGGVKLDRRNVVHVRRGSDRSFAKRGIGIMEQYFETLARAKDQETYETQQLRSGSVPSVVIETPNPDLSQAEADMAKQAWIEKYSGPNRQPAILPAGSKVTPLSWSPNDAQMVEAKRATLQDIANLLRMDGFWVGAESAGLQYKSAGPMYTNLVRQTISPIALDFEDAWSDAWTPLGQRMRFDRRAITRDDFLTELAAILPAVGTLLTLDEARDYLGYGPAPAELKAKPQPVALQPVDQTAQDGQNDQQQGGQGNGSN